MRRAQGGAAGARLSASSSDSDLHQQKRSLKMLMRAWEREFEEANGGLVATHEDKKHDPRYAELKQRAKKMELNRKATNGGAAKLGEPASSSSPLKGRGWAAARKHVVLASSPLKDMVRQSVAGYQSTTISGPSTLYAPDYGASASHDPLSGGSSYTFEEGHMALSPFHVVLLVVACGLPYAIFISAFSLFGFGALIYDYLVSNGWLVNPILMTAGLLVVLLFVCDVSYWSSRLGVLARRILVSAIGLIVIVGGGLAAEDYPYIPLLLLVVITPGYWWLIKRRLLSAWPTPDYLRSLSLALALLAAGAASLWIAWVLSGNAWNEENKRRWMLQMRCCVQLNQLPQMLLDHGYAPARQMLSAVDADIVSHLNLSVTYSTASTWDGLRWPTSSASVSLIGDPPLVTPNAATATATSTATASSADGGTATGSDGYLRLLEGAGIDDANCLVLPSQPCLSVLLFYSAPFVSACAGAVAALLCMMLARALRHHALKSAGVSAGARMAILGLAGAACSLWVSASIAGAGMGVASVVRLGLAALLIVLTVLLDRLFGWKALLQAVLQKEPLARRLIRFCVSSDWSRACAISIGLPLILILLVLSVANQLIRVHLLRAIVLPEERATITTPKVAAFTNRMLGWNWTSVLRKVIVLCVAYIIMMVGVMKATVFFMSWLVYQVSAMPLYQSTGIFAGVGLSMFLLPPVPGAPVYMASGVLLTAAAEGDFGYPLAIVYAMGVAFMIKLVACTMQQVGFGYTLRRSTRVRAAVAINSPLMRAINVMMREKGLTKGKVATLVGGPDWPTSVLMGIMGMPVLPMVLGTTPIIFLVAPLTLSGAFMIRPENPFPALTSIAIAASSLSQLGAGLLMLHCVEHATQTKRNELEKLPYDLEVLELNRAEEDFGALYAELTHWRSTDVPLHMRYLLVVGALAGIIACQAATLFDSYCFRSFGLYPDFHTQVTRTRTRTRTRTLTLTLTRTSTRRFYRRLTASRSTSSRCLDGPSWAQASSPSSAAMSSSSGRGSSCASGTARAPAPPPHAPPSPLRTRRRRRACRRRACRRRACRATPTPRSHRRTGRRRRRTGRRAEIRRLLRHYGRRATRGTVQTRRPSQRVSPQRGPHSRIPPRIGRLASTGTEEAQAAGAAHRWATKPRQPADPRHRPCSIARLSRRCDRRYTHGRLTTRRLATHRVHPWSYLMPRGPCSMLPSSCFWPSRFCLMLFSSCVLYSREQYVTKYYS